MQGVVIFNEEHFPIVSVSTQFELFNESMIEEYLTTMLDFYKKNQNNKVVVIYEISLLKAIDAKARIKVGEWLKTNAETIKNAVAGVCYVQKSALQKIILQGIFAIKSPEWEHRVVTSLEEGISWGKELLKN